MRSKRAGWNEMTTSSTYAKIVKSSRGWKLRKINAAKIGVELVYNCTQKMQRTAVERHSPWKTPCVTRSSDSFLGAGYEESGVRWFPEQRHDGGEEG